MALIEFSTEERKILARKIKAYISSELDYELGEFDAGFLLDFFVDEVGPYFYNRGLYDAQALLTQRLDTVGEAILDLEKPTELLK